MTANNRVGIGMLLSLLAACGGKGGDSGFGDGSGACDDGPCDPSADTTGGEGSATGATESGPASATTNPSDASDPSAPATEGSSGEGSASESASESGPGETEGPTGNASEWIIEHFADAPTMTGDFDERTTVETPALVLDATGTNAKYAFETRDEEAPTGAEVGFVNVMIHDLVSSDAYGGAIQTSYAPGMVTYIANMHVEPNWPAWQDYDTTNYDGIVLDESAEFYAEDLTIVNWNADSAIDIKAPISQFVRLETEGGGNRTLRFWEGGPHYLVESSVNNPSGTVLWFSDCDSSTLNVYDSTFNGAEQVADGDVECENGSSPNIVYLETDPRTTGEMHPMFSVP